MTQPKVVTKSWQISNYINVRNNCIM
jgi:hypothetical protein